MHELSSQCQDSIKKGSKSFSFAAAFFPKHVYEGAISLYAWCRICDDKIDLAINDQARKKALNELKSKTENLGAGETSFEFQAFHFLCETYSVPKEYALELLRGMEMDVENHRYETFADLRLYCFRVAGTVGLMMCHIMEISDERALSHAADLGIAMQLTNIARDIIEDAERGRTYLPRSWLNEQGLNPESIKSSENSDGVFRAVKKLLAEADLYYDRGLQGLRYLPFRPALAVSAAAAIYAEIGNEVRKRGVRAWESRVFIPGWKKGLLSIKAVLIVLKQIPSRLWNPWRPIRIQKIWSLS